MVAEGDVAAVVVAEAEVDAAAVVAEEDVVAVVVADVGAAATRPTAYPLRPSIHLTGRLTASRLVLVSQPPLER